MEIAVTGGTGHIGANLVRALSARGDRVRVLLREDARALAGVPNVKTITGELRDPASLRATFEGAEVVFHLAAQIAISGDDDRWVTSTNVEGTRNVVRACLDAKVRRLVHFSSIHALSPLPRDRAIDESRPFVDDGEGTPYDCSKAAAERSVMDGVQRGLDAVVVNPSGVIGPHDYKPSAMGTVLLDIHHRRLPALLDGGFNWVDVRDVVAGAIAAADRGRSGERYLLTGEWVSLPDLSHMIRDITGSRPPPFTAPMWLARVGAPFATAYSKITGTRPRLTSAALKALRDHRNISNDKARRELGYTSRPIRTTLDDTFRWFREAGQL